jgi:hypothetical protein
LGRVDNDRSFTSVQNFGTFEIKVH